MPIEALIAAAKEVGKTALEEMSKKTEKLGLDKLNKPIDGQTKDGFERSFLDKQGKTLKDVHHNQNRPIDSIKANDLPQVKIARLTQEGEFKDKIMAEVNLNKRIAQENPDLVTTPDGSYPNYYKQDKKICIIGREDRGLSGADYNETLLNAYKDGKIGVNNGYKTPSQLGVHRKSLQFTYGLINDLPHEKIPNANELGKYHLGEPNDYSYAYVNESKASNMKDNSQVLNKPQYDDFVNRSANRGYMKEQMSILKPDLAIGQNISQTTIDGLGDVKVLATDNGNTLYEIKTDWGHYRLINCKEHFSAHNTRDKAIYDSIMRLKNIN